MHYWQIKKASNIVKNGGVIVYPTEAVYGLGCDPLNPCAVGKILDIKNRRIDKGLLLITANIKHIMAYIHKPQTDKINAILLSSETPTTWLFKAAENVPYWLTGNHPTIAIRLTQHPIAKALCTQLGHPLVSTSANISTKPPIVRKVLAYKHFYKKVDYIISGSVGNHNSPSEIRDAASGQILRA